MANNLIISYEKKDDNQLLQEIMHLLPGSLHYSLTHSEFKNEEVEILRKIILACDNIIIYSPIYWNDLPAKIKLMIEKVIYGPDFYEVVNGTEIEGKFTGKKMVVITTSGNSYQYLKDNHALDSFFLGTVQQLNFSAADWFSFQKFPDGSYKSQYFSDMVDRLRAIK